MPLCSLFNSFQYFIHSVVQLCIVTVTVCHLMSIVARSHAFVSGAVLGENIWPEIEAPNGERENRGAEGVVCDF